MEKWNPLKVCPFGRSVASNMKIAPNKIHRAVVTLISNSSLTLNIVAPKDHIIPAAIP